MTNVPNMRLACGHSCFCEPCWRLAEEQRLNECPICRSHFTRDRSGRIEGLQRGSHISGENSYIRPRQRRRSMSWLRFGRLF
mmetsp:Transcript_25711/g.40285  ORF Transcript_25711/g.40285 Transcript_25711/m.40285 type:complete len:82 (-) Transcript_25711:687-932(-)